MLKLLFVPVVLALAALALVVQSAAVASAQCEAGELAAMNGLPADFFGLGLDAQNDVAIVGAPRDDEAALDAGAAYIFTFDEMSGWTQAAKLFAPDAAASDRFGQAVAIDGDRAIVGAIFANRPGAPDAGKAYVFRLEAGAWIFEQTLVASDGATSDIFGIAVDIEGDRAVVGAWLDDHSGLTNAGAAYVFERVEGVWVETEKLTASDAEEFDSFGGAVALSGDHLLIGARQAHAGGIRRLLQLRLADQRRRLARQLPLDAKAQFTWAAIGSLEALRIDIVDQVLGSRLGQESVAVRDQEEFQQLAAAISADLGRQATGRALRVEAALHALSPIGPRLTPPLMGFAAANFDDIREQLAALFPPDLGLRIDEADLAEYPRYLKAVALRVERLQQDPRKDQERMLVVREFQERLAALPDRKQSAPERRQMWWLLQELRVSLFAQELGTRQPVSEKRIERSLQALEQA